MAVQLLEIPTPSSTNNNCGEGDDDDWLGAISDSHNCIQSTNINSHCGTINTNISNGICVLANESSVDDIQDNTLSKPMIKSGIGGASVNLMNYIIGAGIIGVPYAFKQSGLITGIILLILVSFLTDKSLRLLVDLATFHPLLHNRQIKNFESLASYPFGNLGSKFILLNMVIGAYGAMVGYLLIVKDTVPSLLGIPEEGTYFQRNTIMLGTSILFMVPLSMKRDMTSLAITSLFSVFADVLLVFIIGFFTNIQETVANHGGITKILSQNSFHPRTVFIGFGILSFSMACNSVAFKVSGSLENRTRRRWGLVTGSSIAGSAGLCLVMGTFGYLGFLDETQGDGEWRSLALWSLA